MLKFLATSLCVAALSAAGAAPQQYDAVALPARLGDGVNFLAGQAIDDKGRVLIRVEWAGGFAGDGQLCTKRKCSRIEVDDPWSVWVGFNAEGVFAGAVKNESGNATPARRNTDGSVEILYELGGFALGINAAGVVVGDALSQAFYYDSELHFLPTLGGFGGAAHAITDDGRIVGRSSLANGLTRATLFDMQGGITNLGVLKGGTSSVAYAINAAGKIVGCSGTKNVRISVPVLFEGGEVKRLGVLGEDAGGCAYGINNLGVIVGDTRLVKGGLRHAFVQDGAIMVDLNDVIPDVAKTKWLLNSAVAINDQGKIVVNAQRFADGAIVVLLLTPSPSLPPPKSR